MDRKTEVIALIKNDFMKCQKILSALGHETRQAIIVALIESTCDSGLRIGEITNLTHISKQAVSHHLKVLRDSEIVSTRKEGTMTFYHIDVHSKLGLLSMLTDHMREALKEFYGI